MRRLLRSLDLHDFWCEAKPRILLIALSILLGTVLGVVGAISVNGGVDQGVLGEFVYEWYVGNRKGFGGYFVAFLLEYLTAFVVIISCNASVWFVWINYLYLVARGYLIGYNTLLLILNIGAGGIFTVIFVFIPTQLIVLFMIVYMTVYANARCLLYRRLCFSKVGYKSMLKRFCIMGIAYLCVGLIVSGFMSVVTSKLIF